MTVPDISNFVVYRGNNAATVFPYSFRIPESDMVVVEIRDYETKVIVQVLTPDDYIITGVSKDNYNGGEVIYVPPTGPLAPDREIVISRLVPYSQDLALQNQGSFHPKSLEYQLDLIVMQIQQLYYSITGTYIDLEFLFEQIAVMYDQTLEARDQSVAARDDALTAKTQAELAAIAAGAPLYPTVEDGEAGTSNGDMFLVFTEAGVQVFQNVSGTGEMQGWLGKVSFKIVADLLTFTGPLGPAGTIITARGFRYEVAASDAVDHHVETDGGVKLYVLPIAGKMYLRAFGLTSGDPASAILTKALGTGYEVVSDVHQLAIDAPVSISGALDLRKSVVRPHNSFDAPANTHLFELDAGAVVRAGDVDMMDLDAGFVRADEIDDVQLLGHVVIRNAGGTDQLTIATTTSPLLFYDCDGVFIEHAKLVDGSGGVCDGVSLVNCRNVIAPLIEGDNWSYRLAAVKGNLTSNVRLGKCINERAHADVFYTNNARDTIVDYIRCRSHPDAALQANGCKLSRDSRFITIKFADIEVTDPFYWGLAIQGSSDCKVLDGIIVKIVDTITNRPAVAIEDHPTSETGANRNYIKAKFGCKYIGAGPVSHAVQIINRNGFGTNENILELEAIDPTNSDIESNILITSNGNANPLSATIIRSKVVSHKTGGSPNSTYTAIFAATGGGSGAVPNVTVMDTEAASRENTAIQATRSVINCRARTGGSVNAIITTEAINNVTRGGTGITASTAENNNTSSYILPWW